MKSVRRAALWLARDLLTPPELSLLVIVIVIVTVAHVNLIRWGWWQQAVAWLCLWAAAYLLEAALGWAAKRIGVKS